MEQELHEAATWPWWIVAAGFIAWVLWAARRWARRHPMEQPARVTDPVCGMTFEVHQAATTRERDGTIFYFCSDACRKRFEAEPSQFTGRAPNERV